MNGKEIFNSDIYKGDPKDSDGILDELKLIIKPNLDGKADVIMLQVVNLKVDENFNGIEDERDVSFKLIIPEKSLRGKISELRPQNI